MRRGGFDRRLVVLAAPLVAVLGVYVLGGLEFFERRLLDARFTLASRPARSDVVLVDIDPRSLRALQVWPWPRGTHASLLEELLDAGAARVGFDIDFSSRSDPEQDAQLAQALEAARGRVVLPVFHQWQRAGTGELELTMLRPIEELSASCTLGSINVRPDADGLVRAYGSFDPGPTSLPTFAGALAGDPRPASGSFHVDFGIDPRSIPRISYVDVLAGSFERAAVAGRTVIVGSTAVELGDQIAVPLHAALPGPLLQALAYESIAQRRELRRVPLALGVVLVLVTGLPCAWVFVRLSWRRGLLVLAGASCTILLVAIVVQMAMPLLLDASPHLLAFAGAYAAALVVRIDRQALGLVHERKRARRAVRITRRVVDHSFDAILAIAPDGTVVTWNEAAERMFGYRESEIVGGPASVLLDVPATTSAPVELRARHRNGTVFEAEAVVTEIEDGDTVRIAFLRDITERKRQERILEHRATHDPLTDLANRTLFLQAAGCALERPAPAAILLLDLDGFKEINDTLGHATGDRLLQLVAQRLRTPLRSDDLLARLGGDEFAVLVPGATRADAAAAGERLRGVLREPFPVEDLSLRMDVSIGVALCPEHGGDAHALLRKADVAMYAAKRAHTGVEVYDAERDRHTRRLLALRGDLRHAIESSLLDLAFQPKLCARSGALVGSEALVRWTHSVLGAIPPGEFVPFAEHSGLIRPLTLCVLSKALRQAANWRREGLDAGVAVNLSALNLVEEDLPLTVERLLEEHACDPRKLTLEITEGVLMENPERSVSTLRALAERGVRISIDDFGTGYSSLAYLTRLPAQEIKIDRSLVMGMSTEGGAAIVRATIELAHSLGLTVVAEGVETEEVWAELQRLGCDVGQGYHFSRPVPAETLLAWVQERSACYV